MTGIRFDPAATEVQPRAVGQPRPAVRAARPTTGPARSAGSAAPTWRHYQDYVVGLPRGSRDHLVQPDGLRPRRRLYFGQASNTAMGAPDSQWDFRPERLLTAAILRVDLKAIAAPPLDVKTADGGGAYDPFAAGAPLTLYATGVRNAFDLLWHSNGQLYAPVNGSSAGGSTPGTPDLKPGAAPRRLGRRRPRPLRRASRPGPARRAAHRARHLHPRRTAAATTATPTPPGPSTSSTAATPPPAPPRSESRNTRPAPAPTATGASRTSTSARTSPPAA